MNGILRDLVGEHEDLLIDSLERQLSGEATVHYRELGGGGLRLRMRAMLDAFRTAVGGDPDAFRDHYERVARERLREGFDLEEVQTALVVFEETLWRLAVVHVPVEDQVVCLGELTSIVGEAKDLLARTYLALLREAGPVPGEERSAAVARSFRHYNRKARTGS